MVRYHRQPETPLSIAIGGILAGADAQRALKTPTTKEVS